MELNVAYSSDDNYAKYMGISILSLLENNKDDFEKINIYIIDNNISKNNKEKLMEIISNYNACIIYLEFNKLATNLKTDNKFFISSFGRIFLSNIEEIDKIVYLDCDSMITSSLMDLWNINIDNYYLAGVQDTVFKYYITSIGLKENFRYINAGFLLINLRKWRKDDITTKCIEFIDSFNGSVPHHDQGTINAVCNKKIYLLPPKYNMQSPMFLYTANQIKKINEYEFYYEQAELEDGRKNPIFVHFTAGFYNRPWFSNCTHPLKERYLEYYNKSPWKHEKLKKGKLCKNVKIMKALYNILPFNIYIVAVKSINKIKGRG